jgi:hypothetical protein
MSEALTRETSDPNVFGDSTSESNSSPMVSGPLAGLTAALLWIGLSSALIGLLVTSAAQKSAPRKSRPLPSDVNRRQVT